MNRAGGTYKWKKNWKPSQLGSVLCAPGYVAMGWSVGGRVGGAIGVVFVVVPVVPLSLL